MQSETALEILEMAHEAVVVVNESGEIVLANAMAEQLFGYSEGELAGLGIEALIPSTYRERHARFRDRFHVAPHARPLVSGLGLKGQCKDGRIFDAEIALTPIPSDGGLLISSTIRDISGDDTSEAYFRNVLESAPDAMVIIDHLGKITVVNGQAEQMFGYARNELLGQEVEMLLPDELRDRHVSHRAAFAADAQLRPMGATLDLEGQRSDGSRFPVEISLSPFSSASGSFVSSVIRDVTERKQMEAALIEARQLAERANNANSAFLAAASHDLRQPVQALSLLNGALRRTVRDPLALEMIESQQNSLDAMTNLLNSLLDISRLDAGKVEPQVEEFNLQRLVDRLYSEFARQARNKGLRFESASCESTLIRSDPNLLGEIIQNFVSNAIRYTDRGSVTLHCREDGDGLVIEVSDTGIGIDGEQFERIFQEFQQIKVPGAKTEGFGLGLAIVKRLAELLDHEVSVSSEPGKGSTFSVRVPLVGEGRAGFAGAEGSAAMAETGDHDYGLIILIEDDDKVANAWSMLLEAEGFGVVTATCATDAAEAVTHLPAAPDLIISDFHLHDGSTGSEAVDMIRAWFDRNIPAFIVTGDTSKMVQETRDTRNCVILNKPVDTERLLQNAVQAIRTGEVPAV